MLIQLVFSATIAARQGITRAAAPYVSKAHAELSMPAGQKDIIPSGGGLGQEQCTVHSMTTHVDAECYVQRLPRLQPDSARTMSVILNGRPDPPR